MEICVDRVSTITYFWGRKIWRERSFKGRGDREGEKHRIERNAMNKFLNGLWISVWSCQVFIGFVSPKFGGGKPKLFSVRFKCFPDRFSFSHFNAPSSSVLLKCLGFKLIWSYFPTHRLPPTLCWWYSGIRFRALFFFSSASKIILSRAIA